MPEQEKKNKEIIEDFKIGSKDISGNTITRVFSQSDHYIVYEIDTNTLSDSIKVMINPESDDHIEYKERNYEQIKGPLNDVKGELYKAFRDNSFKHMIAAAVSLAINAPKDDNKNIEKSKTLLVNLKERIIEEYEEQFRNKLIYVFTVVFIIFCLTATVFLIRDYTDELGTNTEFIKLLLFSFTSSTLGGFLALTIRLKKIYTDPGLSWYKFVFYGIERSLISITSCFIVIAASKSNLALGFINELNQPFWGIITLSLVAGYSETFIPDILTSIEKSNK